jgi:hypothetical protein
LAVWLIDNRFAQSSVKPIFVNPINLKFFTHFKFSLLVAHNNTRQPTMSTPLISRLILASNGSVLRNAQNDAFLQGYVRQLQEVRQRQPAVLSNRLDPVISFTSSLRPDNITPQFSSRMDIVDGDLSVDSVYFLSAAGECRIMDVDFLTRHLRFARDPVTELYEIVTCNPAFSVPGVEPVSQRMAVIERTVGELQARCSEVDRSAALVGIAWESDVTYASGARAPPWREVKGDLGYLLARTWDKDTLFIVASLDGFFVARGFTTDENGKDIMDYNPTSATCETLDALLRVASPHYADAMDKIASAPRVSPITIAGRGRTMSIVRTPSPMSPHPPGSPTGSSASARRSFRSSNDAVKASPEPKRTPDAKATPGPTSPGGAPGSTGRLRKSKSFVYDKEEVYEDEITMAKLMRDPVYSETSPEVPQINKLVKFLKGGNVSATIIAVSSLQEYDLTSRPIQKAIKDVGGIDPLIGLVMGGETKLAHGCADILCTVADSYIVQLDIVELDGIEAMLQCLGTKTDPQLLSQCIRIIGKCASFGMVAKRIRQNQGVKKLIQVVYNHANHVPSTTSHVDLRVRKAVAFALARISARSDHNREALRLAHGIQALVSLLQASDKDEELVEYVASCFNEMLKIPPARPMFVECKGLDNIVDALVSVAQQPRTKSLIASCIANACFHDSTRDVVLQKKGIPPICSLLSNTGEDIRYVINATAALRELSKYPRAISELIDCGAISTVISLLESTDQTVQSNVSITVANCAKNDTARSSIRNAGGINTIIRLLHATDYQLLASVCESIGELAEDDAIRKTIIEEDALRLLWSLLKHPDMRVKNKAAFAVHKAVRTPETAGQIGRLFVGGLTMLNGLLNEEDMEVIASVLAALAQMTTNSENLNVLCEEGLLVNVARVVISGALATRESYAKNPPFAAILTAIAAGEVNENTPVTALLDPQLLGTCRLLEFAALAVSRIAVTDANRRELGKLGIVNAVVEFLRFPYSALPDLSKVDPKWVSFGLLTEMVERMSRVHRNSAVAIRELSEDEDNARALRDANVVELMVTLMETDEDQLQDAAGKAVENIRKAYIASGKTKKQVV